MTHRRRPHTRSRNGCLMCKKRHMKCDERGPPCSNCEVKNNPCVYPQAGERRNKISASREYATPRSSSQESLARSTHTLFPSSPGVSTPPGSIPLDRHLLELELMHRWCTSTARSLCSKEAEVELFLVTAPQEAKTHEFLLNEVLALASLDIAMNQKQAESPFYINTALEYYHKASAAFRPERSTPNPDTSINTNNTNIAHVLSSFLATVLSIALPQHICPSGSSLENAITMFTLISNASTTLWNASSPEPSLPLETLAKSSRPAFSNQPSLAALDGGTILSAIRRLDYINDDYYSLSRPSPTSRPLQWKAIATHSACRRAIAKLDKVCTQREKTGFVFGWPALVEPDFASALKESNPVALMVLMHWGAMVEHDLKNYWWTRSVGQSLVVELSGLLQFDASPVWQDAIAWARCHAGLPLGLDSEFVQMATIPDMPNELFFGLEFL